MVVKSALLMFVLLNPFTMSVYLSELIRVLDRPTFTRQLLRGALISAVIFLLFAGFGNTIFTDVLQVRFLAFQIFGGITFLIIGTRLILGGDHPVPLVQPSDREISGSIAMPYIVGPGTISAAVITGSRLDFWPASIAILAALGTAIAALVLLKLTHDYVLDRNERLVARYSNISGRVTALFTGAFAIEMILNGLETWLKHLG